MTSKQWSQCFDRPSGKSNTPSDPSPSTHVTNTNGYYYKETPEGIVGYYNGKPFGVVLVYTEDNMPDLKPKKKLHNIPILAVDSFDIEVKTGYVHEPSIKTFQIPTADITFSIDKGDESEVVAAVRLTNHQIQELLDLLKKKLDNFQVSE